jgi:hypothetical protein
MLWRLWPHGTIHKILFLFRPETHPSPVYDPGPNFRAGGRDDPMTGKSKERIGAISKDIFSNVDFREANQAILVI